MELQSSEHKLCFNKLCDNKLSATLLVADYKNQQIAINIASRLAVSRKGTLHFGYSAR